MKNKKDSTSTSQPIALVTGANKGLGQQIAKELVGHGYIVLLGSRDLIMAKLPPMRSVKVLTQFNWM